MLPTQRTALVEMTRWSMICMASAPPRHNALTTPWTSCWWTTTSLTPKPSGISSLLRWASSRETVTEGPLTGVSPAAAALARERRSRSRSRRLPGAASRVSRSTSLRSASTSCPERSFSSVRSRMTSGMSTASLRRSVPRAVVLDVAKRSPAPSAMTGTRADHPVGRWVNHARTRVSRGCGSTSSDVSSVSGGSDGSSVATRGTPFARSNLLRPLR